MKTRKFHLSLTVLLQAIVLASSLRLPHLLDPKSCPHDFRDKHPLIVLSMDGFRADYVEKGLTPTVEALFKGGVRAPFIKPSYPSITFPNHYTIVTGLLPPYHGIVANKFFDPEFNATFRVGRKEFFQRRFWGGEPIWMTAEKQGITAATYFWPGSETEGLNPTHWLNYNESHPFNARVDRVLHWLDLPASRRPQLINFYLHEPDRQGHNFGPDSPQVRAALRKVDNTLRYLLEGLEKRNILSCVNLLLLSDHGMAAAGRERLIHLQHYIPSINRETRFWDAVFARFQRNDRSPGRTDTMMNTLACRRKEMRVYHKQHLPTRWHLGAQRRVEDVVLDLDPGFQVDFDGSYKPDKGDHGYDNIFHLMNALFVGHGPAFKRGVEVESFQNIELYNLMCVLLGVQPAPNNGTWGALHHLLQNPPTIHESNHIEFPPIATVSVGRGGERDDLHDNEEEEEEEDDDFEEDEEEEHQPHLSTDLISLLRKAESKKRHILRTHIPWGPPQAKKTSITMLLHDDHVTGFSENLRLPVWVSFQLKRSEGTLPSHWVDDVRISSKSQQQPYDQNSLEKGFTWEPLFDPEFSKSKRSHQVPFLSTNAVPVTDLLRQKWKEIRMMLRHWSNTFEGGVNVVMGTIFDYNFDTLADDFTGRRVAEGSSTIPTHLFLVVTRCLRGKGPHCPDDWLDVNSFIFPQYLAVSNCMDFLSFAREFSAKVDDVEKAAGLQFFPKMIHEDRTRLKIRLHSNLWGMESWKNRIRSDAFGLKRR